MNPVLKSQQRTAAVLARIEATLRGSGALLSSERVAELIAEREARRERRA